MLLARLCLTSGKVALLNIVNSTSGNVLLGDNRESNVSRQRKGNIGRSNVAYQLKRCSPHMTPDYNEPKEDDSIAGEALDQGVLWVWIVFRCLSGG